MHILLQPVQKLLKQLAESKPADDKTLIEYKGVLFPRHANRGQPHVLEALQTWKAREDDIFITTYPKAGKILNFVDYWGENWPGGTQYYEIRHVPPKRSPFLKPPLTQWPLVYALPPIDPNPLSLKDPPSFWFVTQRPVTSDFVTQKPIILIIWPKLWLVTITEARILRDL